MSVTNGQNKSGERPGAATAIVGGGISGLATAYELGRCGAPFALFEASDRFGGIVETVRSGEFVIECGPDSWITEKPWAGELAVELGLKDEILPSNDRERRTYLFKDGKLAALPDGMRMMVPVKWAPLLESPLFSWQARLAYLREPRRAAELKASAVQRPDESVGEFVRRHFGDEVTSTIAGPLLAGVFGGDVETLSARAVMPAFVKMEAEHGSLITAMQQNARETPQAIFSSLVSGLGTLVDRLVSSLPPQSLHLKRPVASVSRDISRNGGYWSVTTPAGEYRFDSLVLATPPHITRQLLAPLGGNGHGEGQRMAGLLPQQASSAIVVALAFDAPQAARMRIPRGFGFLVAPPARQAALRGVQPGSLLACTFVDQKFPHRAPAGGALLRAYFGGPSVDALLDESDESLVRRVREQLGHILGPLPEAKETLVRRWPLSLPQYTVGHNERICQLETLARTWPGLHLVGNAYHGVGVSDLIREGRATARKVLGKDV
jgi:protoporphyrinogen/coproporphyrinogen III oxidase